MSAESKVSQDTGDETGESESSSQITLASQSIDAGVPSVEISEYVEPALINPSASAGLITAPDPNVNSSACQDGQMPGHGAEIGPKEVGQGSVSSPFSDSEEEEDMVSSNGDEIAVVSEETRAKGGIDPPLNKEGSVEDLGSDEGADGRTNRVGR